MKGKKQFKRSYAKKKLGWSWNGSKGNQTPPPALNWADALYNNTVSTTGVFVPIGPFGVGNSVSSAPASPATLYGGRGALKYLDIRGAWFLSNTSTPDFTNLVRSVVFHDNDSRGTTPLLADVLLTQPSNAAASSQGILSHPNLLNRGRIQVLDDRMWDLSAQGPSIRQFSYRVHCKNLLETITPSLTTGVQASVQAGLWVLFITDSSIVPNPQVEFYSRCFFKSMA